MGRYILFFSFLLIMSCNEHIVFEQRSEMPGMVWSYDNPLSYEVVIEEATGSHDIYLDVEHSREFQYSNLYTGFTSVTPGGDTTFQQISITLSDQLGRWLGTCKGNECSRQYLLKAGHSFSELGAYKLIVEQYSREKDLQGIKSIQLSIQQVKD